LHAERDGKEFGIQISVSKDEVELNKELPSRLFKARIPRTYEEMKDDEDDEDVEEAEQEAVQ
jgi:hypothetical protein